MILYRTTIVYLHRVIVSPWCALHVKDFILHHYDKIVKPHDNFVPKNSPLLQNKIGK